MNRFPTLGRCGAVAVAVAALAEAGSPQFALALAALTAPLLWRAGPLVALVPIVIALRSLFPDVPAAFDMPIVREMLARPILAALPEPDASIAVGSLLGGKADLPRSVRDAFALTGTTHLLAASGFNITLVAGALGAALRPAGARAVALGTMAAAIAMAIAAGMAPSIVRAALMSLAASLGVLIGRPSAAAGALGATIVVLLFISPHTVSDVGFLLSITATGGLLYLAAPLERACPGPTWLRAQLASTCAATFTSLPVSAEVFGRVSLVSPLANLVVAPLVAPLMTATGAAMLCGSLAAPLGEVPAWAAYGLARLLRGIVELAAAVPGASVSFPHAGAAVLAVYGFGLVLVRVPRMRLWLIAALVTVVVGVATVALAAPIRDRIVALDVGQGDAFLLEASDARALIDGGPDPARTMRSLVAALPSSTRLDIVALTHSHVDHEAGLVAVLERYEVGLALEPVGLEMNAAAVEWREAVSRHHVPLRALTRGDRLRIGDLELEALAPLGDPLDPLPNLALRAKVGSLSGLFLGDASERGQEDLLLRPADLRADVYAPPHHGAATPHAEELVLAAQPRVAFISVGAGNRYGHPTPQTLRALARVKTLRTDRDGTLEAIRDGDTIRCTTRSTALPRPWDGWLSRSPPCV